MNIMHTIASDARTTQSPKRRFYSPELKLQVVGTCAQPAASIAGVALQHGINANIVHRWLREHSQGTLVNRSQTFVPVTLNSATEPATAQPATDIRVEVKRVNATIVVH
jgi:transposase